MKIFNRTIKKMKTNKELKMNVKPKFFKVMKQKFFTLIMMFALVIAAGSAFGQAGTKFAPFVNTTHTYTLAYNIGAAGSVALTISPYTNITLGSTTDPAGLNATGTAVAVATTGDHTVSIPITYSATASGTYTLSIVVSDGTCSNNIHLDVTIAADPTYNIAISTSTPGGCQALNGSPDSNVDASEGSVNTVTYTITPGTAPDGVVSYSYTVGVASAVFAPDCGTCGSGLTGAGNYSATFESVEGAGGTVVGTVSVATFTMDAAHGAQTYNMNITTPTATVTYSALPTIATFE
jgi:hypothetical protein